MTDTFDQDLQTLGMLALDHNAVDEFTTLYQELLERTFNDMMDPTNAQLLAEGVFKRRGEQLKAILHEEVRFLGGEPPVLLPHDNRCHTASN